MDRLISGGKLFKSVLILRGLRLLKSGFAKREKNFKIISHLENFDLNDTRKTG